MPPQVNAALVRVTTTRAADATEVTFDYDAEPAPAEDPDATGPLEAGDKWRGRVAAYYREKLDRVTTGEELNIVTRRTLYVDTAELPDLDTDDVLEVDLDTGATVRARARNIARSSLAGIPSQLQTTKIELEAA